MAVCVKNNTPEIVQNRLKNIITVHQATVAPYSRLCPGRPNAEEKGYDKKELCSQKGLETTHLNTDNLYTVDKFVRHAGYSLWRIYALRWYWSSKEHDTAETPLHTPRFYRR